MTIRDLVAVLEQYDEDTEVRLAMQPSWPFEYSIADVVAPGISRPPVGSRIKWWDGRPCEGHVVHVDDESIIAEDDAGNGHEVMLDMVEACSEAPEECSHVVYLTEGRQLGYLPGHVSEVLGWR
mgnify:CR=1 FL=1